MPLGVLLVDGGAKLYLIAGRGGFAKERLEDHRGQPLVAGVGKMKPVDRQGLVLFGRLDIELARRGEEIDERDVVRPRHAGHGGGVITEVGIVEDGITEVGIDEESTVEVGTAEIGTSENGII